MNTGPYFLTVGDFNRDGNADIISANGSTSVGVLLGTAAGTFSRPLITVWEPLHFATEGDINGDDRVDITAITGNGLSVLLSGQSESASIQQHHHQWMHDDTAIRGRQLGGDGNYGSSTSAPQTFTANKQTTSSGRYTGKQFCGPASHVAGHAYPLGLRLQSTNGEAVTFKNGTTVIGTASSFQRSRSAKYELSVAAQKALMHPTGVTAAFTASNSNVVPGTTMNPSVLTWEYPGAHHLPALR